MKTARHQSSSRPAPPREFAKLRPRLADAEETLRAIRTGEVDTVMVAGKEDSQVFTLEGAEHAYRVLIESMNEGALTLTADKMILYANHCFARMVKCPLEQVIGSSFRRFLSAADRATLRHLLKRAGKSGSKIQVFLHAGDGSKVPAQISIRSLAKNGFKDAPIGMVVTDMTEARRAEEQLRSLTHRVVQVQEAERGRVALELPKTGQRSDRSWNGLTNPALKSKCCFTPAMVRKCRRKSPFVHWQRMVSMARPSAWW